MFRLSAMLVAMLLCVPALAQAPAAARWIADVSPGACLVSLRDATPVWRVRLDIVRHPQGRVAVIIGVNDQAAPAPRPREDRLRVAWVGSDGEERGHDLPIAGAREAVPGRPMVAHSLISAGSGLDAWLRQAGEARSVLLSLPSVGPFRVPAAGFTEAWSATEGCAPRT